VIAQTRWEQFGQWIERSTPNNPYFRVSGSSKHRQLQWSFYSERLGGLVIILWSNCPPYALRQLSTILAEAPQAPGDMYLLSITLYHARRASELATLVPGGFVASFEKCYKGGKDEHIQRCSINIHSILHLRMSSPFSRTSWRCTGTTHLPTSCLFFFAGAYGTGTLTLWSIFAFLPPLSLSLMLTRLILTSKADQIKDLGPACTFRAFTMERYIGKIKGMATLRSNIDAQLANSLERIEHRSALPINDNPSLPYNDPYPHFNADFPILSMLAKR